MAAGLLYFLPILLGAVMLSYITGKLTAAGASAGALVALAMFLGAGIPGIVLLGSFFLLGVAATSAGTHKKEKLGATETGGGRRNAGQVFANGGAAALSAGVAVFFPELRAEALLVAAASLAAATSDTLSSELGMLWGTRCYNILSLKKDRCGENGVVSAEGTAIGLAGSLLIASIYALCTGWLPDSFFTIALAGFAGNIADSVLGAALERKGRIGNNAVNFLQTLVAAAIALLFIAA